MTTTVTRYVNTASSGGDGTTNNTSGATAAYASLSAALDAEARDLVTPDEIARFLCSGSAADTIGIATTVWSGFVCNTTTNYIEILPNTGQEHGPGYNTGVYRIETTDASALQPPNDASTVYNVKITGIQVKVTATTGSTRRVGIGRVSGSISSSSRWTIRDCIAWMNKTGGTATNHAAYLCGDTEWLATYGNCLAILTGTDVGDGFVRDSNNQGSVYVHNCGAIVASGSGATAFDDERNVTTGTVQVKNCWAKGFTTFSAGAGIENSDFNSTDLASASGGANDRVSQTFTFVNEAGGEYRPDSSDAAIRGRGTDLSADANLPITTDMEGVAVHSPPDIGPLNAESSEEGPTETRWRIYRAAA